MRVNYTVRLLVLCAFLSNSSLSFCLFPFPLPPHTPSHSLFHLYFSPPPPLHLILFFSLTCYFYLFPSLSSKDKYLVEFVPLARFFGLLITRFTPSLILYPTFAFITKFFHPNLTTLLNNVAHQIYT